MEKNRKTEIRTEVKRRRAEASPELLHAASIRIKDSFIKQQAYDEQEILLAYVDAKREVETRLLMQQAWADGKQVVAPRVDGNGIMHYYFIRSLEDLEPGSFGIMEPKKECPLCETEEGLLLMPGVAFDVGCHRVGYGEDIMTGIWKSIRGLYILRWHLNFRCLKRFPLRITISCRR